MKLYAKLGRCNARVYNVDTPISVVYYDKRTDHGTMQTVEMENCFVLESYASIVAIYDRDTNVIYELPRSDYSNTTKKHVDRFIAWIFEEVRGYVRKYEKAAFYSEKPYAIYNGW